MLKEGTTTSDKNNQISKQYEKEFETLDYF